MGAGTILPDRRPRLPLGQGRRQDRRPWPQAARDLIDHGLQHRRHPRHRQLAGRSTASPSEAGRTRSTKAARNIVDRLKNDDIALVMNTTEGTQAVSDSRDIRAVALYGQDPLLHHRRRGMAAVAAMKARLEGEIGVRNRRLRGASPQASMPARAPEHSASPKPCPASPRAVSFEARGTSFTSQAAVAHVVLNRAESGELPDTPCAVVEDECQFSYRCDGRPERMTDLRRTALRPTGSPRRCWRARFSRPTGALFFHAERIEAGWFETRARTSAIGGHVFYR